MSPIDNLDFPLPPAHRIGWRYDLIETLLSDAGTDNQVRGIWARIGDIAAAAEKAVGEYRQVR